MTSTTDRSSADRTAPERGARVIATLAGLVFVVPGVWAFVDPRSFFDALATFEPYNPHLLRDVGAFQIGLGVVLLLSVRWRDALQVALVGVGVGAGFHLVAHVLDRDLGGTPATDIPFFAVVAVALLAAAIARALARRSGGDDGAG